MKIINFISFMIFILWGCKDNPSGPIYAYQYDLWRSYSIHDYTIVQTRNCFCINGGEKMIVTVQSDTIFSVSKISDSAIIPKSYFKEYLTIDSLFGVIQHSKFDSIVVAYDPEFGYPVKLDINPQLHPIDGGIMYETSNLKIINKY